ncbi:Checkpoint protein hus1, partial [Tilletia horrida]
KNKTPLLSFSIVNASHNGARLVVVQDALIRILKLTEMERIKKPLCPAPDVRPSHPSPLFEVALTFVPVRNLTGPHLPPLLELRTVCDRMRSLADVVHVSANRQGKFRLKTQEDEITMEKCWRNLQDTGMVTH